MGGGIPTVGQCSKKKSGVKRSSNVSDKDKDGCYRVPGYRGVWVDPKGKHFIKVNDKAFTHNIEDGSGCDFYESSEEAARTYDDIIREKGLESSLEINYKPDGSRIKYDDQATSSGVGRGLEMLGKSIFCLSYIDYRPSFSFIPCVFHNQRWWRIKRRSSVICH